MSIAGAVNVDNHTRAIMDRWVETYQKEGFDGYVLRLAKDLYYPDWMESHLDYIDRLRAQAADQEVPQSDAMEGLDPPIRPPRAGSERSAPPRSSFMRWTTR